MSKVPATWVDIAIQLKNASRPLDDKGVGHLTQADLVLSWIAAAREEARAEALRPVTDAEMGTWWNDTRHPKRVLNDILIHRLRCGATPQQSPTPAELDAWEHD